MEQQLLDQLENKVELCVETIEELRSENGLLREEISGLEEAAARMAQTGKAAQASKGEVAQLRARCRELEKKLSGTKARVQRIIKKIGELER